MTSYTRLTIDDRELIYKWLILGVDSNEIARRLDRASSTISREIRRGGRTREQYSPIAAEAHSKRCQSARKLNKRKIDKSLAMVIEYWLTQNRWSPEQISGHLRTTSALDPSFHISHEAIYQYIYNHKDPVKRQILIKSLRRRKKQRCRRKGDYEKRGKIPNMVSIHDRSEAANNREEIGHWEGDLVIGKSHKTGVLTLVERVSRYVVIVPLGYNMTSEAVLKACKLGLRDFPSHMKKSLTYDRGKEMSFHEQLTADTGIQVYFADPHSPWQRGTNENTNGLIRDFFPKGTDFTQHSVGDILEVTEMLNIRPRKILGYRTPQEVFRQYSRSVA